jgi:hypothetical protein
LGLAAGDDAAGLGVAVDLGVEVLDERRQVPVQGRGDRLHAARVVVRPADVLL